MDVPLTAEQEAELSALAAGRGLQPSGLIEHDEVVRRVEQRLSG